MKNSINLRFGVIAGMIAAAAVSRFLFVNMPSMANFSPVGTIALFGGAYYTNKRWAYAIPMLALWLSNLVLNNVFYKQWYPSFSWGIEPSVFVSIALMVTIGQVMLKKVSLINLLASNLVATLAFFLLSNFFVWYGGTMYSQDWQGLTLCYIKGLAFLDNTLVSNLFFSTVMFGSFEWMKRSVKSLAL